MKEVIFMTKKIYLENPYLRDLNANIIKKEYIDNKFHITLDRTIFYPHMCGGQPKDEGTINGLEVLNVYQKDNKIIHVVKNDIINKEVTLSINWNTRFDHMQQHTGQHILSVAFTKLFNANTVGFHLGKDYVYIDVTIPNLTKDNCNKIEKFANKIIFSNFDIKNYFLGRDKISKLPLSKKPPTTSNIRIVEINGIDFCPCAGTHCRSTGEVGLIKIRKWEKYKGNIRVEFVSGNRALEDYIWKNNYINDISNILSVKDKDCLESFKSFYENNKLIQKETKLLHEQINYLKAEKLLNDSLQYENLNIISKIFDDEKFKDIRHMTSLITEEQNNITIFGLIEENKCKLIIGKSSNIKLNIKEIFDSVIDIIDGTGGGNTQIVQGGGNSPENLKKCIDKALNIIKNSL